MTTTSPSFGVPRKHISTKLSHAHSIDSWVTPCFKAHGRIISSPVGDLSTFVTRKYSTGMPKVYCAAGWKTGIPLTPFSSRPSKPPRLNCTPECGRKARVRFRKVQPIRGISAHRFAPRRGLAADRHLALPGLEEKLFRVLRTRPDEMALLDGGEGGRGAGRKGQERVGGAQHVQHGVNRGLSASGLSQAQNRV